MKALLLLTTALAGYALARPSAPPRTAPLAPVEPPPVDVAGITRNFLLGFVMPLWLAAGIADWLCHRATDIEHTTGVPESLVHLLMLFEAAIPVLAGLFLEITSPVLALMIAAFLLHDMTALWDVSMAVRQREVTPIEQHVHSFLEMVPLMAVAFVSVLHWPQARALFGIGEKRPDWSVRLKQNKLPWGAVTALLAAMIGLEWVPYIEELVQSRAARSAP